MNILKYLLIACSCLIGAAHAQSLIAKDTIEYRAQVWVDKTDLERYGGEGDFKKNLKKMFHNTTRFWNESPNKFNHYFALFLLKNCTSTTFRETKTDMMNLRIRLMDHWICRNMILCCSWRWVQRMKGFPVGEVERVGNL